MNREEYDSLLDVHEIRRKISISNLVNQEPRTLLWGYTPNRESWHVYIKDEEIHLYQYGSGYFPEDHHNQYKSGEFLPEELIPSKRLYPEACDYEFCALLKRLGCTLPFTTWQDNRPIKQYYGDIK